MGLIQQLISMSVMVKEKTKLFIKSFQDCFISTFKYNGKIDVLELELFNNSTNKVWYDDKNNRQTREDLVNMIIELYKSIQNDQFLLGDVLLSQWSGLIDKYCENLEKKTTSVDTKLLQAKVKAICEYAKITHTENLYTDLNSVLEFVKELNRE
ncbi:2445_t:CDS:1 [Gigaspora margarita]|uniref:2445_t:CDS:1 n=1 Tax=Gigaspora margarita TaxID=4874 RepID=A0ABN7WFC8_GIGMA|nr:2445_t:CDS:1 [Gigaspora margarita]